MRRFALALLLALCVPAFGEQKTPPPPSPPRPIPWPAIMEKKLDNGLTVVMAPLASVPKITAELTFLAGRGTEYRTHPGLAQLAHLVHHRNLQQRPAPLPQQVRRRFPVAQDLRAPGVGHAVTEADQVTRCRVAHLQLVHAPDARVVVFRFMRYLHRAMRRDLASRGGRRGGLGCRVLGC